MAHSADPTKHKEYHEQRKRYEKRKASGHWTGKTKAERAKAESTVSRGIGKAMRRGRELDELLEELKR